MKKYFVYFTLILAVILSGCNAENQTVSAATLADPIIVENEPIIAEGDLLPSPSSELAFQQSGIITQVSVSVGDKVQKGNTLAVLQGYENAKAQWENAKLELTIAQQAFDEMKRNALLSDVEVFVNYQFAQDEYEKEANRWSLGDKEKATELELLINDYIEAQENYQDARDDLEKYDFENESHPLRENAQETYDEELNRLHLAYQDLLEQIPDHRNILSDKQLDILQAIGDLETARDQLNRLENGLDLEIFAIANAQYETAQQNVEAAEEFMQSFTIVAPMDGTILSISKIQPGDQAAAGLPVIFVANNNQWIIETIDLAEIDITKVKIGSPVSIKFDGIPNETFSGKVLEIESVGHDYLGDNTYQVTIAVDNPDARFLWNMTATVSID